MITARDRLIVAMDLSTLDSVNEAVVKIGDAVSYYKIGMNRFIVWEKRRWT